MIIKEPTTPPYKRFGPVLNPIGPYQVYLYFCRYKNSKPPLLVSISGGRRGICIGDRVLVVWLVGPTFVHIYCLPRSFDYLTLLESIFSYLFVFLWNQVSGELSEKSLEHEFERSSPSRESVSGAFLGILGIEPTSRSNIDFGGCLTLLEPPFRVCLPSVLVRVSVSLSALRLCSSGVLSTSLCA